MMEAASQVSQVLKRAHKALKANPRDANLHHMVAPLYEQLGRYDEALPHLAFLVSHTPIPDEMLYVRYAQALQRTGASAKAVQAVNEGLKHYPQSTWLLKNMALAFMFMAEFGQARQVYYDLHTLDPSDFHSISMAGALTMLMTEMHEGYEEYALRPMNEALARYFDSITRWAGESLASKRIVVRSEQGVGDVVMFLGLYPWLAAQAPVVSMVVTGKLAPLVARSCPGVTIISEDGVKRMGDAFDYHVPLGDLLSVILPHHTPADHPAYLLADAERASRYRESYLAYARERGRTKLIGLSWHTTNPQGGFTRNITLKEMHPIFSVPGVQFVSLQYGDHAEEIAECNRRNSDILYQDKEVDAFNDLDGVAAQMAAMDEIITIDNATVHLAGALGIPTTVLLSTAPDWRWGLSRSDCRWYKSVHLERQEALLKWQPVIKRIRARVMDTMAGRS